MSARISRRDFLQGSAAVSMAALLGGCADDDEPARPSRGGPAPPGRAELAPTPACDDGDSTTPEQTEGPYYTPDTPRRRNLVEAGMGGEPLLLAGRVLDTRCRPVAGALLDFWQADADGAYDNEGFRLRGHQFADPLGRFRLSTLVPGIYSGRTRHIHVKVQPRGGRVLTTQLYFPDEPENDGDSLFDDALLMAVRTAGRGKRAAFTFVLS